MDPGCGAAGGEALQGAAQLGLGIGRAAHGDAARSGPRPATLTLDGPGCSTGLGESLGPGTGATDDAPLAPWMARLGKRGGGRSVSGTATREPLGLGLDLGNGTCAVAAPPEDENLDGAGSGSGDSEPNDVSESSPGTAAASGSGGTASADLLDATPPGHLDPDDAVAGPGSAGKEFQQERDRDRDRDGDSVRDCENGDRGNADCTRGWF